MKLLLALLLLSIVVFASAIGIGRKQSVGAKGKLVCNGKPVRGVKVKLYDDDRGLDSDDHLGTVKTDGEGRFEIAGSTHEISTIDPKVNIYHDCEDGLKPCQRKISVMVPDSYVNSGSKPKKYYDAGTIELAGKFKGKLLWTRNARNVTASIKRFKCSTRLVDFTF